MQNPPVIVFDLDGTLVDTAPDLIGTLNVILARENLPPVPLESARQVIGGGARKLIERGLALEGRTAAPHDMDRMFRDFIAHYGDNIAVHSRPFDGTIDILDDLAARGHALAICTNKLEWLTRRLLDALSLTERFAFICGADTFGISKPAPDGLRQTIEKSGGSAPHAVMIGDSAPDVGAARALGIPVIGVDFGYTDIPIHDLNPDIVISHMRDLPNAIGRVSGSQK